MSSDKIINQMAGTLGVDDHAKLVFFKLLHRSDAQGLMRALYCTRSRVYLPTSRLVELAELGFVASNAHALLTQFSECGVVDAKPATKKPDKKASMTFSLRPEWRKFFAKVAPFLASSTTPQEPNQFDNFSQFARMMISNQASDVARQCFRVLWAGHPTPISFATILNPTSNILGEPLVNRNQDTVIPLIHSALKKIEKLFKITAPSTSADVLETTVELQQDFRRWLELLLRHLKIIPDRKHDDGSECDGIDFREPMTQDLGRAERVLVMQLRLQHGLPLRLSGDVDQYGQEISFGDDRPTDSGYLVVPGGDGYDDDDDND